MTTNHSLQGIYQFGSTPIYLAWQPVDELFMFKRLHLGTPVGSYNTMQNFSTPIEVVFLHITLLHLGWLSTDTIPSDLYPELFI